MDVYSLAMSASMPLSESSSL